MQSRNKAIVGSRLRSRCATHVFVTEQNLVVGLDVVIKDNSVAIVLLLKNTYDEPTALETMRELKT